MEYFGNDIEIYATKPPVCADQLAVHVLVVDDNAEMLELLGKMVESLGYVVSTASDARSALTLAQDPLLPLDLLITDINMPGMSGIELARHFRAVRPETRVLFASASGGHPLAAEIGSGAYFLAKPFTRADLIERISNALGGKTNYLQIARLESSLTNHRAALTSRE